MKYTNWGDEPVDGAGLTLSEHAGALARDLNLDEQQTAHLVAEIRNALVPALVRSPDGPVGRAIERVLALADALAELEASENH